MKLFDVEIPLDGLAVTIATFMLSPDETRVRNTIVIALIHGTLHPYEVGHHIDHINTHNAIHHEKLRGLDYDSALTHINDRRFNFGHNPAPHGSDLKIRNVYNTFHQDVAYFKHQMRNMNN